MDGLDAERRADSSRDDGCAGKADGETPLDDSR
jgi:hypothetical protein